MEQRFRLKISKLYVVLCQLPDDPFFYDLCINKKYAHKFTIPELKEFDARWKDYAAKNGIKFGLEEIKRNN